MAKWLARGVSPAVSAMVRGALPAAEHQELVRQLCAAVAQRLPDFALGSMVLELLQVDLQAGEEEVAVGGWGWEIVCSAGLPHECR